jgi:hypothetical protein
VLLSTLLFALGMVVRAHHPVSGTLIALAGAPTSTLSNQTVTPPPILQPTLDAITSKLSELEEEIKNPPKDIWDKMDSISGLSSGVLLAIIGAIATYVYRNREIRSEELQKKRELDILQVQTIQGFMPQLQSGDPKATEAAILAISALGNAKLASDLAALYQTEGAVSALSKIATGADSNASSNAEKLLVSTALNLLSSTNVNTSAQEAIENTSDLLVGGNTLSALLQTNLHTLSNRLKVGARLRFILLNPTSPDILRIAVGSRIEPDVLANRIRDSISLLKQIAGNEDVNHRVEIRLTDRELPYTFLLSNPGQRHGILYLSFTGIGRPYLETPMIEIESTSPHFKTFIDSLENLWQNTSPVSNGEYSKK